ncbi:alpha/beta hydrolase, partial [Aliiglaciecola sp.]|nr:alpha/beta hydrolase [Aliiglaciecola sp.]
MGGSPQNNQQSYSQATPNLSIIGAHAMLFQGANDNVVPSSQGSNSGLTTITNPQAGHFDWIHPGT